MSQVTYNSEKLEKKKVIFSNGTGAEVTLRGGYALCYDHSLYTIAQSYTVVRPATNNLRYLAGAVTEQYDGTVVANGGTAKIEIYVPTKWGQIVPLWITEDHSANEANLQISDSSFAFTEGSTTPCARTVQQVNRSSTNGTCLSRLFGVSHAKQIA